VTFSDRSTGYPDKWTWTFTSDGGKTYTSSEQNPEIIFEEVGIYSVKLVAENPVCKG
jgi:PKD repeat protein